MISLRDSVEIHCTPEKLFSWLRRMPDEYNAWHPEHVSCRVLQGSMLEAGSEIECKEILHGKLHSMRFRLTNVVRNERIEFKIEGLGGGAFIAEAKGDMVIFVAELNIGSEAAIIGRLFDLIFPLLFFRRIEAMRRHMTEEGQNLKAILEAG